jgi:hypothetical protein
MVFTEIKVRNSRKYYYRVISIRKGKSVSKRRVYLGTNLARNVLLEKEILADRVLVHNKELEDIIPDIKRILLKHNVKKAGIFGSYAKGKQRKGSDIDIIIQPPEGIGFGFAGISQELEKKLNRKVDFVSYAGLSPHLKDDISKHEIRII